MPTTAVVAKSRAGDSTRPTSSSPPKPISSSVSPPRCESAGDSPRADSWTITEQTITSAAGAAPTTGHEAGLVGGQVEHAARDRMCLRTSEWDGTAHSESIRSANSSTAVPLSES
ncbi:hypothetical protein [Streptomyces sp. 061-3]|uniref:hypothetical protein n=1 Tax=Streptomyces sp. 061-3 TaxID=2789268 RepID=UPI003980A732